MRFWKFVLPLLASSLCFAAQSDRITGPIDSSQMVALTGNVHGLAQPRFDLGRTDGSMLLYGVTLAFRLSAAQHQDLTNLLAQQQDRSSPNYHKWLTPAQFGARFGMSQNDINRVIAWLESKGFTVTSIANSRNQITFDGTVAQIESAFDTEIHNYLIDSEVHFANATNPSVPAALAGSVLDVGHLHNFSPKPRAKFRRMSSAGADPHFTSAISGNHFLTPGDFATIYGVQGLYSAGVDGTGQTIAVVGQSTVNLTDLSNFRSAAGLPAKAPQLIRYPSTSTAERCAGDEGESDLDLEWSGGVAQNANIIFVYAGLVGSDTCAGRDNSVWNALQQTVDNNYAPIISTSYGSCEASNGELFADEVQGWVQQANTQGQTLVAASGDSGAADCDGHVASASHGLAVDVPAAIPEVTGVGGTEFFGDAEATVSGGNASTTTYWNGTTGGADTISSAVSYIPEMAWNDTVQDEVLSASGGGASLYFAKPTWQTGAGVPTDGKRDVPDLALSASPNHDGYLICSEDGPNGTVVATCTSGFRTGAGGDLTPIGGTSCAAPTFAAITALINESLGSSGLVPINPTLYALAASNPTAFHDVTTGSNIVPCTSGTVDCPSGTVQYGFSAGVGYDQVTGLGSVDATALAAAWKATLDPDFALAAGTLTPSPVSAGQSAATTLTISPVAGSTGMVVNFSPNSCTGLPTGATCSFNPPSVNFNGTDPATTVLTIATIPTMAASGPSTITITPTNSSNTTATVSLAVTATTESFALQTSNSASSYPVTVGGNVQVGLNVISTNGFIVGTGTSATTAAPLTYTCTGTPSLSTAEIACQFSPTNGQSVSATAVTLTLVTTPATSELRPLLGVRRFFYALLLPGLFGIVLAAGSRTRGLRLLSLIMVLGFSTLWLGSCGGSGGGSTTIPPNPGTPPGTYTVTISATTGGAAPLTNTNAPFTITLNVTP